MKMKFQKIDNLKGKYQIEKTIDIQKNEPIGIIWKTGKLGKMWKIYEKYRKYQPSGEGGAR